MMRLSWDSVFTSDSLQSASTVIWESVTITLNENGIRKARTIRCIITTVLMKRENRF